MALVRLKKAYPDYRETFGDNDKNPFDSFNVYTEGEEQIGSVKDGLVDEQEGRIRYLIVDTGFWVFGKNVLLPIGLARFDYDNNRVYVNGLSKEQVENLPEFTDDMAVDQDYEERVRSSYRPMASRSSSVMGNQYTETGTQPVDNIAQPVDASAPLDAGVRDRADYGRVDYDPSTYTYDQEPGLYAGHEENQPLRLFEERLIASKHRVKTGEVSVGKHVETDTARVSVPIEKERIVIDRVTPTDAGRTAINETPDFREGEVMRMDVYEETPDVRKEAVVREEVRVHKEVDRETVEAQDEIRREEVDINTQGNPTVDRTDYPNR